MAAGRHPQGVRQARLTCEGDRGQWLCRMDAKISGHECCCDLTSYGPSLASAHHWRPAGKQQRHQTRSTAASHCGWLSAKRAWNAVTYWVLCCICLVYRHGCPLSRTRYGPSIGPASTHSGPSRGLISACGILRQRHCPSVCPGRSGYFAPPDSLATRRGVRLRATGQVMVGTR